MMLDEEKKLEIIKGMGPGKIDSIRKVNYCYLALYSSILRERKLMTQRLTDLQATGATRENNAEFSKMVMILELWNKAQMIE